MTPDKAEYAPIQQPGNPEEGTPLSCAMVARYYCVQERTGDRWFNSNRLCTILTTGTVLVVGISAFLILVTLSAYPIGIITLLVTGQKLTTDSTTIFGAATDGTFILVLLVFCLVGLFVVLKKIIKCAKECYVSYTAYRKELETAVPREALQC